MTHACPYNVQSIVLDLKVIFVDYWNIFYVNNIIYIYPARIVPCN